MNRTGSMEPAIDGKQASGRVASLRNPDCKGIEFDAFRKSAPFVRHGRRGVMGDKQ